MSSITNSLILRNQAGEIIPARDIDQAIHEYNLVDYQRDYALPMHAFGIPVNGDGKGMYNALRLYDAYCRKNKVEAPNKRPSRFLARTDTKDFLETLANEYPIAHVLKADGMYLFSKPMVLYYMAFLDTAEAVRHTAYVSICLSSMSERAAAELEQAKQLLLVSEQRIEVLEQANTNLMPMSVAGYFHPAAIMLLWENGYFNEDGTWANPFGTIAFNEESGPAVSQGGYQASMVFGSLFDELPTPMKEGPFCEIQPGKWLKYGYPSDPAEYPDEFDYLEARWRPQGGLRKLIQALPQVLQYE